MGEPTNALDPFYLKLRELHRSTDSSLVRAMLDHATTVLDSICSDVDCGNYLDDDLCTVAREQLRGEYMEQFGEIPTLVEDLCNIGENTP